MVSAQHRRQAFGVFSSYFLFILTKIAIINSLQEQFRYKMAIGL